MGKVCRDGEMVDTYASGAYAARHGGSSPLSGTRWNSWVSFSIITQLLADVVKWYTRNLEVVVPKRRGGSTPLIRTRRNLGRTCDFISKIV